MSVKIEKKIVKYEVNRPADDQAPATTDDGPKAAADVIQMTERIARPEGMETPLEGATYKIKTPLDEHALYVTINDLILNEGTEHESRRPFEIFINSKNMDHFQWIVALTRVMSAVFRKGGDVTFLSEELQAVFDPRGGYFKAGGKFMPSLVAEIGAVVEQHLKRIGMIADDDLSAEQQAHIDAKRAELVADLADSDTYPESATLCHKCSTKAVVIMDGCETCLSCGYSKCG